MVKEYKVNRVKELVERLQEKNNIVLTNYSGIKVKDLTELRKRLREKDVDYKVVKNNLLKRALQEVGVKEIDEHLKGPIAVAFTRNDLSDLTKILKDFKKEQEKFNYFLGIMDNEVFEEEYLHRIAALPSREVLIGQILSLINAPVTNIAMVLNQSIAALPRSIKLVAEKNEV